MGTESSENSSLGQDTAAADD